METLSVDFLIKDSPSAVAILDKQMCFLSHSKLWLENLNIKDPNIVGKSYYDVIPDTSLEFKKLHTSCLKEISNVNKLQKIIQPNGRVQWLNWRINGWSDDDDGSVCGLIIGVEDITERKRKEELLIKAQSVARIGGWELNLITNKNYMSDTAKILHELPLDYEPSIETNINFYKKGEHRDKAIELVSEAMAKGTPWEVDSLLITAKGKELWVRSKGEVEIINNKCVRLFGTIQDIDQKKKIELQHQEISERFNIATQACKIGIWELDILNKEVIWDDNMYSLYGLGKKDFNGTYEAWEAAVHPEDKTKSDKEVEMAIAGKKAFNTEFRIIWPNGEIRHIRAESTIKLDENGNPVRMIGANWDITDDREAERKLKNLLEVTSQQNKSLMNFAYIVSHNLRSHTSNLSMLTSFLSNEEDENEKKSLIEMLNNASESLSETVQYLNEVVSVKTNLDEKLKKMNLQKSIKSVENNLSALLREKNAVCKISIDKSLFIKAVPAYLDSILLNLFTNSLKYSSPKRTPIIEITAKQISDNVIVYFKDNGIGIDLARHGKKLFGMYKTFHRNEDAQGIGLFMTRNQIEAMNGKIEVESKVDKGTTFKLSFIKSI